MEQVIFKRARHDERKVKERYLVSYEYTETKGYVFHWTSKIENAMKVEYTSDSYVFGEISTIEDILNEEYYKYYGIYVCRI